MPTMNKIDLLDCANGHHNYKHGGEHGDPCTVCGHVETESHGVEVWMCATIYVDAESEEAAAAIVAKRYTGTRDTPDELMIGTNDISIWHNKSIHADKLAPTTTIYGLASESKLVPEADPLRDAAPDMLAALREARSHLVVDKNGDGRITGVSYDSEALRKIVAALDGGIAKAEGGAASTPLATAQSLEAKYGRWQDHPDYSDRDWRDDETRLDYWEWVASKVNAAEGGAA